MICGGVGFAFLTFMIFKSTGNAENLKSDIHYKKEISTGVESLSPKDMWIEGSANELNDLKKQNKDLQEQLDKVQKVVIGMGRAMNIFDDQVKDKANTIASPQTQQQGWPQRTAPLPALKSEQLQTNDDTPASPAVDSSALDNPVESNQAAAVHSGAGTDEASFTVMRDFVRQSKSGNGADPTLPRKVDREKLAKSGIKTIKFSNADNEYNLDENFIFAATYARCALVGSVTVSAGVGASSNPQPVLLRLTDPGNLPNKVKGFLKDAMVIGAAYGELSSESVVIRLERIVKIDKHGVVGMDIPVQGYVAGENGDSRIRGVVIDRAGATMKNAAIGGFFSGVADFLTMNNSSAIKFEPNSGLAQFSPQQGSKMLGQGASKGIGNAIEKYADFYIKRSEQLQPVIQIDGGRKLTVVFTQSVKAAAVNLKKVRKSLYTPINARAMGAFGRKFRNSK